MINITSAIYRPFLIAYFVLLFGVYSSNSQCTKGMCEKKVLSLKTGTKQHSFLDGYVFETLNFSTWEECYHMCVWKCQCLSFNFNEVNETDNCELNDGTEKLVPEALKEKEGVVYYEIVRSYYDKNGGLRQTCNDPSCHNKCCDSTPCQHGGTCHEVCDVTKRRFNCTCQPGFSGHKCQITLPPRSCKDIMVFKNVKVNGIYNISDPNNVLFPVYCDFDSEPGMAWTLIQSHSFQNNGLFKNRPFFLHDMPINQDAPEWIISRLSMSRMKSIQNVSTHFRATCNFPTDGVDYRDYWRVSLETMDLFVEPATKSFCLFSEFVNIRGNLCTNCTVLTGYSTKNSLHTDSWYGFVYGCEFDGQPGAVKDEDNFGFLRNYQPSFPLHLLDKFNESVLAWKCLRTIISKNLAKSEFRVRE